MALRAKLLFVLVSVALAPALRSQSANCGAATVQLPHGRLRGKDNGYYYSYESIPYAVAPVGELRFEAPRRYAETWTDVFDATRAPVKCMQWNQFKSGRSKLEGTEDCLTINVYKPKVAETGAEEPLPVIAGIHGGAFMFGTADSLWQERFMRSGRVIVATIAYRLGPLGFLSTGDDVIPGNYGLKDQRLAIEWLKEHIKYFGGDPAKITAVGFSAGGASVHLHMLQRNFSHYAASAVSFSGTALNPWVIMRNSRARAHEMARHLNCPISNSSMEIKKCLQSLPAERIVAGVRNFLVFGYNPFTTFGPVVEPHNVSDAFLTKPPDAIIQSGDFARIPWLVSYAAQDGGYNAAELLQRTRRHNEELLEVLNDRWYDLAPYLLFYKDTMTSIEQLDDHSRALKQRYMGKSPFSVESYWQLQQMYTDVLFRNGIEQAIRMHSAHSTSSPVYAYVYDNPNTEHSIANTLSKRNDIEFGTCHGDDFSLMFFNNTMRDDERLISQQFIKMLEDFAAQTEKLRFGSCDFADNVGQEQLQLMVIKSDSCSGTAVQ